MSRISILDSVSQSFSDFDLTDIYFSNGFSYEDENVVKDITIINIGAGDRASIAKQLNIINGHNPKVIGMDALFIPLRDSVQDNLLKKAFERTDNLVFISRIDVDNNLIGSNLEFTQRKISGHANFEVNYDNKSMIDVVRKFVGVKSIADSSVYPFAVEVASCYNPSVKKDFTIRSNRSEHIYFTGYMEDRKGTRKVIKDNSNIFLNSVISSSNRSTTRFRSLDEQDIFDGNFEVNDLKDKIVLIGYLGNNFDEASSEDKHYSQLNPDLLYPRPSRDMYGLEVHANIVAMLINDQLVLDSKLLKSIFSILIMLLFATSYLWLFNSYRNHYQLISKASLLIVINIMIILFLVVFHFLQIRLFPFYLIGYVLLIPDTIEALSSLRILALADKIRLGRKKKLVH